MVNNSTNINKTIGCFNGNTFMYKIKMFMYTQEIAICDLFFIFISHWHL